MGTLFLFTIPSKSGGSLFVIPLSFFFFFKSLIKRELKLWAELFVVVKDEWNFKGYESLVGSSGSPSRDNRKYWSG